MKRVLILVVVLLVPLQVFSHPKEEESIRQIIDRAVSEMQKTQEPGGEWPYEGVYRVRREIPVGYRIGGTAIVCQMLFYAAAKDNKGAQAALSRGLDFILKKLKHHLMRPSTRDAYDVRVWGHAYALTFFCQLRAARRTGTPKQTEAIKKWIPRLVKALVIEELPRGGWNYATRRRQASFVTAPVTQALLWARSQGEKVSADVFKRSRKVLLESRHSTGAFTYSGKKNLSRVDVRATIPGSIARSALCESTLMMLGAGSIKAIQNAIDAFHTHWIELENRRKKSGTHAPPYGIAPYYFYFAHRYAAQAIELLPEAQRPKERKRLRQLLLRTRDNDGTWNDRVFPRSRSYGTAMAILSLLAERIPLPNFLNNN